MVVRAGNEQGKTGKVLAAFPKTGTVLVEGVGMRKKHQKPRREGQKGQIVDKQHPIAASKVMEVGKQKERAKRKKSGRGAVSSEK